VEDLQGPRWAFVRYFLGTNLKIAIVGTGPMGSVYAGLLGQAGHEVWAIDTWQDHTDAIATTGLLVSGASGTYVVDSLNVGRVPEDAGPCDVWVIATTSIPEPGHVHHEGMRLIRVGEMDGGMTDRLETIEQAWDNAGFTVRAFGDVGLMVREKFLCNVTLSAPCAAFDVTVGELMSNDESWKVALACTSEAHRVALAMGVEFLFYDALPYVSELAATVPNASPSMRLDHLARRRSEIDVINGRVVTLSPRFGLEAPYNETLCAILRQREANFPETRRPTGGSCPGTLTGYGPRRVVDATADRLRPPRDSPIRSTTSSVRVWRAGRSQPRSRLIPRPRYLQRIGAMGSSIAGSFSTCSEWDGS
jgi:2-dehydropantoate 2-reductase